MTKNTPDEKQPKRRTEVKDLPQQTKELSEEEQKEVGGGWIWPADREGATGTTPTVQDSLIKR